MVYFGTQNSKARIFHYFTAFLILALTFIRRFRKLLPTHYKKPIVVFNYGVTFFILKQVCNRSKRNCTSYLIFIMHFIWYWSVVSFVMSHLSINLLPSSNSKKLPNRNIESNILGPVIPMGYLW